MLLSLRARADDTTLSLTSPTARFTSFVAAGASAAASPAASSAPGQKSVTSAPYIRGHVTDTQQRGEGRKYGDSAGGVGGVVSVCSDRAGFWGLAGEESRDQHTNQLLDQG